MGVYGCRPRPRLLGIGGESADTAHARAGSCRPRRKGPTRETEDLDCLRTPGGRDDLQPLSLQLWPVPLTFVHLGPFGVSTCLGPAHCSRHLGNGRWRLAELVGLPGRASSCPGNGSKVSLNCVSERRNYSFSMQKGKGRTSRIRRRKLCRSSEPRGVNESHKSEFIELRKWLKARKFQDSNLAPACFPGTGRGLMSQTSLQPLFVEAVDSIFSYSALLWAWCTVNTRAVYLRPRQRECLSAEPDTCALAPYLDLLNHSPRVQVKAAFNEETHSYEIRTTSRWRKHEEVFICYGPHDNQRLFLEYGFVSVHNPHACVYVSREILVKYLPSRDKQMDKKISILKDHGYIENLTFGWDGPSWRLLTALKLLCLEAEKFTCWKKVLLGEVISDTNEKTSLDIAQKICYYFMEETNAMLQKVSHMKDEKEALINQLTLVESLWTEELKVLRASAKTLHSLQTAFT
ncbi:SET domain-containing protein 4 isoform X2 [Macaca nemestrina]|uniref:SET domain-containing protein 4 isoform X2 n=2 Tax=Macaca TaxID=9539 RepID=UPI000D324F0C|nr:SET domain-containing protein 4 isoform X2 [Macaca nemestrina]